MNSITYWSNYRLFVKQTSLPFATLITVNSTACTRYKSLEGKVCDQSVEGNCCFRLTLAAVLNWLVATDLISYSCEMFPGECGSRNSQLLLLRSSLSCTGAKNSLRTQFLVSLSIMSSGDGWPTTPNGSDYDGTNLLQLMRDGCSPFADRWDVNLLILEIEHNLATKVVDIPTISMGSNNYVSKSSPFDSPQPDIHRVST